MYRPPQRRGYKADASSDDNDSDIENHNSSDDEPTAQSEVSQAVLYKNREPSTYINHQLIRIDALRPIHLTLAGVSWLSQSKVHSNNNMPSDQLNWFQQMYLFTVSRFNPQYHFIIDHAFLETVKHIVQCDSTLTDPERTVFEKVLEHRHTMTKEQYNEWMPIVARRLQVYILSRFPDLTITIAYCVKPKRKHALHALLVESRLQHYFETFDPNNANDSEDRESAIDQLMQYVRHYSIDIKGFLVTSRFNPYLRAEWFRQHVDRLNAHQDLSPWSDRIEAKHAWRPHFLLTNRHTVPLDVTNQNAMEVITLGTVHPKDPTNLSIGRLLLLYSFHHHRTSGIKYLIVDVPSNNETTGSIGRWIADFGFRQVTTVSPPSLEDNRSRLIWTHDGLNPAQFLVFQKPDHGDSMHEWTSDQRTTTDPRLYSMQLIEMPQLLVSYSRENQQPFYVHNGKRVALTNQLAQQTLVDAGLGAPALYTFQSSSSS